MRRAFSRVRGSLGGLLLSCGLARSPSLIAGLPLPERLSSLPPALSGRLDASSGRLATRNCHERPHRWAGSSGQPRPQATPSGIHAHRTFGGDRHHRRAQSRFCCRPCKRHARRRDALNVAATSSRSRWRPKIITTSTTNSRRRQQCSTTPPHSAAHPPTCATAACRPVPCRLASAARVIQLGRPGPLAATITTCTHGRNGCCRSSEANTVYSRICMNAPIFSPICLSGVPCPTKYTFANSGCPCIDPCASTRPAAAVIPSYACPSSPRTQNPFVEGNATYEYCPYTVVLVSASSASTVLWITKACAIMDASANAFYAHSRGIPGAGGSGYIGPKGLFWSFLTNFCGLSIEQITDGTSTTLFCTEMAGRPDCWTRAGKTTLPTPISDHPFNSGGAWASPNAVSYFLGSDFSGLKQPDCFSSTNCPMPVCFINCTNEIRL